MDPAKRVTGVEKVTERIRTKMKLWGITVSYLSRELGVSRQYAWQIVRYRTFLSLDRVLEIEHAVDTIIAQQKHLKTFGDRLRAARKSAGLTLKQVAGMIGYTWVGVERWEKNICLPKPGVLWHLCSVYGVSPEILHSNIRSSPRMMRDTSPAAGSFAPSLNLQHEPVDTLVAGGPR